MENFNPALYAGTPDIVVISSAGTPAMTLRFLRHPDAPDNVASILTSRSVVDMSTRAESTWGARPLQGTEGQILPDAVTVTALSGGVIKLYTADGDGSFFLVDVAGRPLWAYSAQRTVKTFSYEPPAGAGRLLTVTETVMQSDGTAPVSRVRERIEYGEADSPDVKSNNLLGAITRCYDNGGYTNILSLSLTGLALKTEHCLLPADAPPADWILHDLPATEAPLTTYATCDATGATLTQTNAANVTTLTVYDISGALAETRLC